MNNTQRRWVWEARLLRDTIENTVVELLPRWDDNEFDLFDGQVSLDALGFVQFAQAITEQYDHLDPTGVFQRVDRSGGGGGVKETDIATLNNAYKAAESLFEKLATRTREVHRVLIDKAIETGDSVLVCEAIMACPDQVGRAFGFDAARQAGINPTPHLVG